MNLWIIAIIIFTCTCGVLFHIATIRKAKKPFFVVLSVTLVLNIIVSYDCLGQKSIPTLVANGTSNESTATTSKPSSSSIRESGVVIMPTIVPNTEKDAFNFVDPYIDEAIALIDADRRLLSNVTFVYEKKLLYDNLSQEEKVMYDEMLNNAQCLNPYSYTVAKYGYEGMDMALVVYGALKNDHPEIENYFILRDVTEGKITTALETIYIMPWDAENTSADLVSLHEEILRFEAVCNRIIERMPQEYSTYDKYRYLASVISLITSYAYEAKWGWQVGTAYGAIIGGHSICQGYSRGFLYLCQKANLWCETVDGIAGGNAAHMWNIVKLDSGTYFLDITWSDEMGLPCSIGWNKYFMLTQDEILVDHVITDGKLATGTAMN